MSTRAATGTPRKSTEVRRTEIIDAAMRILASEGARQFTVDRVAGAVGLTGGSIFRHFGSMEEVLDAVVDRMEEILFADFPSAGNDPLRALQHFFAIRVRAIRRHPEISRLLMTEGLIPNSKSRPREARLKTLKRKSQRFVADCLARAAAEGLLATGVRPEDGSLLVLGAIHAIGHMGLHPVSAREADAQIQRVWTLLALTLTGKQITED